jgi:phosphate transport system protein
MNHLHSEIKKLKQELIEMADLIRNQLEKSFKSLIKHDKNLAREVLFNEKRVNAFELKIDKDCENIFALYTPVANDLRFVFATLKSNSNLERMGDNAEGIAQFVVELENEFEKELIEELQIKEMGNICLDMMGSIISAYQNDDTDSARQLFEKDKELNELNKLASEIIAKHIISTPQNIHNLLRLLILIRKIERTGDLVKSMAEEIIFYVEAKVIRHGKNTLNDLS